MMREIRTILAKLAKRLFRKRRDPLASLRGPIPIEVVIAERQLMHAELLREVVLRGRVLISPYANVAPGTYGAAVMDAYQRGYIRLVSVSLYDYASGGWTSSVYEATQHGLNSVAAIDNGVSRGRAA